MSAPSVSIVVVPREQFAVTERALDALLERTFEPHQLVYVDGNSPAATRDFLRARAAEHGFELVRTERYLTPNEARNLGLERAAGERVVFVDNDLIVSENWLAPLLRCAAETGAWIVGPLYLEGEPEERIIHMAGGTCEFRGEAPRREFHTEHLLQHEHLDSLPAPLTRSTCDFVEFHCMLLTREALDVVAPFDERLMNTREHIVACLDAAEAGGGVWLEPASLVTYKAPPPLEKADRPYFLLRWSECWTRTTLRYFIEKYGLDPAYEDRASIAAARRGVVFRPFTDRLGATLGAPVGRFAQRALGRIEQVVNRVRVRGDRAVAGAPAPRGGAVARGA